MSQLTHEEMKELTGAGTKNRQIEVLTGARIPFFLKANDWPTTTWAAVNATLSGKEQEPSAVTRMPENSPGFNLAAISVKILHFIA